MTARPAVADSGVRGLRGGPANPSTATPTHRAEWRARARSASNPPAEGELTAGLDRFARRVATALADYTRREIRTGEWGELGRAPRTRMAGRAAARPAHLVAREHRRRAA